MLQMYLSEELVPQKVQFLNDAFFDLYRDKIQFDENVVSIIQSIDEVQYAGDHRIYSKFERGVQLSVTQLSTGCKTAINVFSFPEQVFYLGCGENAIQVICNFDRGKVLVTDFFIPERFHNEIEVICAKRTVIVSDNKSLERLLLRELAH